jgi:ribose transport system permease protein
MVFLIAMGEIDLSVAGIFGLVSSLCAGLIWLKGFDPWLAVLICLAAGVVMGIINGLVTNLLRIPLLIVSLGMLPFYYGINLVITKGYAITAVQDNRLSSSFFTYVGGQLYGVPIIGLVAIACCIVLQMLFAKTPFGMTVRAIGSNPAAARLIAIRVRRTRVYTTALVGLLSAIAGLGLMALYKNGVANVGLSMELRIVAAVVIGGTSLEGGSGTMIGALLGALIMATIDSGIVFYGIDPNYSQLVIGLVILIAIVMDRVFRRKSVR